MTAEKISIEQIESELAFEIAMARHGQDVTASDLANRLMPFIRRIGRIAFAEGCGAGLEGEGAR